MRMESKHFVKEQVEKLAKKYPFSNIRYYFDNFDNDHFICVSLKSDLNDLFSKQAWEIDQEFVKNFPNELLSFMLLEDYLEFGESAELVYEVKMPILLETHMVNFKIPTVEKEKYEFKENIEILNIARSKSNKHSIIMSEIEEDYAFAA